ncbi:MAG: hypothetical protein ACOYOH_02455 [Paracraurococcus sp.]
MVAALAYPSRPTLLPRRRAALRGGLFKGLAGLAAWAGLGVYRPERHYMRGGNTQGSRSLAAARARIARQR